ncbi:MAG TPA: ATP-binding protein [Terriglobales bacterium]|nr:ATP-binding protein [Terriglobales bacterium]
MFGFKNYSIAKKLITMNMLVTAAALLLAGSSFVIYDILTFRDGLVRYLSIQAQIIGSNSVSALLFNDKPSAENTLSALRTSTHIQYAAIYGPDGAPFAGYWRGRPGQFLRLPAMAPARSETHRFEDGQLDLAQTIVFQGKAVGAVYITSDLGSLTDRLRRYEEIVAVVLLVSLLAALLVSWLFQRAISRPLADLAETARLVSRDRNYSVRAAPTRDNDEVATLIAAFNEMLEQIHQRDLALQRSRDTLEMRVQERTAELSKAEDSLRALSRRLLQMQDEERQRIARELHDGSGQVLAALSMNLSLLQARSAVSDPEAVRIVKDSIRMVEDILKDLRTMSYLLHPPLLEDTGLESALRWYVDGFVQRSKIAVTLEIAPDIERLPREVELAVFRIVQECLTNIHRHSGSTAASVHLSRDAENLCLEVRDQGKGIFRKMQSGGSRPGVGIHGMRERVRQLGGRLEVHSAPGQGTVITATLPLQSPAVN